MRRWFWLPLVLCLWPHLARGDGLTLAGAVRLALGRNPELAASAQLRRAAELEPTVARGAYLPTLTFSSSITRVDWDTWATANSALEQLRSWLPPGIHIEPFLYRDTYRTEFILDQPIWLGGSLRAGRSAALARAAGARAEDQEVRAAIVFRAKAAFYRLWGARELLRVAKASSQAAQARRDEMADRHAVGEVDLSVRLRWEVYLSEHELARVAAEGAAETARADLNTVLGREPTASVQIAPPERSEDPASALAKLSREEYLARVLAKSPRLAAARAVTREARAGIAAARAGWLPSLFASGSYGWKQDDDLALDDYRTWSASIAVSYPLFDGLRNYTRHRQAAARARAAAYATEAQERAVALEAIHLYRGRVTAAQQLITSRAAREHAAVHLRVVSDRFDVGLVSNVTLVDAQAARDRAEANLVGAASGVAIALAAMERLLGVAIAPAGVAEAPGP